MNLSNFFCFGSQGLDCTQANNVLSRNPASGHKSDKNLLKREVPEPIQKSEKEPVLITMIQDINVKALKRSSCKANRRSSL